MGPTSQTSQKFRAKPNVNPPGAVSPIGGNFFWGGWNFFVSKVTWLELIFLSIRRSFIVDLGGSTSVPVTFLLVDHSSSFFSKPRKDSCQWSSFLVSIFRLLLKIFPVKVESCPKSRRIFEVLLFEILGVGALVRLGYSLARVKIGWRSTPRGWNFVFRKSRFGWIWFQH